MALPEELKARLTTHPETSGTLAGRIFPARASQTAIRPYVVYHLVSTLDQDYGFGKKRTTVRQRVQLDIWADSFGSANDVKNRVRRAVDRWGADGTGGIILDCMIEDDALSYEAAVELHKGRLDCTIWHVET